MSSSVFQPVYLSEGDDAEGPTNSEPDFVSLAGANDRKNNRFWPVAIVEAKSPKAQSVTRLVSDSQIGPRHSDNDFFEILNEPFDSKKKAGGRSA